MVKRHRSDNTQADIVRDLRKLGYVVEIIGEPVDLLIRHPTWRINFWVMAECKTANRAGGKYRPTKKQQKQADYCFSHGIPYFTSFAQALEYLQRMKIFISLQ